MWHAMCVYVACILCVKSVVRWFLCVTGVDHNFMSHFISLTLTHWTLHERKIQVGSHTHKKNLRDDVMELPGRAQAIWGWGRRVVNQWKSSFWLQSVQTPPLTSLLSFKWKPQSKSQCATRTKQATEIYLHSRAIKWKSTRNKYSSFSKMNQFQ